LQRRFFDRFLKGEDSGWGKRPRVFLQVRHPGEKFVERARRASLDLRPQVFGKVIIRPHHNAWRVLLGDELRWRAEWTCHSAM
jgi:hypothetical protein